MKFKNRVKRWKKIYTLISLAILILFIFVFFKANKGHYLSSLIELIKLKAVEVYRLIKAI